MAKKLVVVESPAKARTIAGFLGPEFVVESSIGHIRDLPRKAADIPKAYKGLEWAKRLGVDVDNDFKALYVIPPDKSKQVRKLRGLLKDADELYLATDEDREGEAIAWHLVEVLNPRVPVRRMVFHEITEAAIRSAAQNYRDIDRDLVDAQEARRILDRLFGYEVSPVLWKKVRPGLSAGRVQSPATRILVERERERIAFRIGTYWDLEGVFAKTGSGEEEFTAGLAAVDGVRVASGRDFDATGQASGNVLVLDQRSAEELADGLEGSSMSVRSVERKPYRRSPYPPFRTSTLQQEAGRQLRFASARTMRAAQRLYENGYITYMRTDSTTLSEAAVSAARAQAAELYGPDYVPAQPRRYKTKVKSAQEAHEAIRPAGDGFRTPEEVAGRVDRDEARVYELIWKRTVASQMKDAVGERVQIRVGGRAADDRDVEFAAAGKTISFFGFLRAYVEGSDDPDAELEDRERRLPPLSEGDPLTLVSAEAKGHETKPPSRFTEASLVKRLEELGIGRPSTYSTIISTILDRGYAWRRGSALVPSLTALATVGLLEDHFDYLVDYTFTARMEDDLDRIAAGEEEYIPWLSRFYFGNGEIGLRDLVARRLDEIDPRQVNSVVLGTGSDGNQIVARSGRYGPYLQSGDQTAAIPDDLPPDELTLEKAQELLTETGPDRVLGDDPASDLPVMVKSGPYGPYIQLGETDPDSAEKPRRASLFKDMTPETVTLEEALRLLSLPRIVGVDPADGAEITAQNGRYGPYIKKEKETRSLRSEAELLTITLDEALALLAQPKTRGKAAPPLRELGADPASGKAVVIKDGKWGPYVTDGKTNASLKDTDSVSDLSLERALELLEGRRQRDAKKGSPKPRASKRPSG